MGVSSSVGDFAMVLISALSLALLGALYSHEILVPLLLDYLSEDASLAKSELHLAVTIVGWFRQWTLFRFNFRLSGPNNYSLTSQIRDSEWRWNQEE